MKEHKINKKIMQITKSKLLEIYELLLTMRKFELNVGKAYANGRVPGFVHLYLGEEAITAGIGANLDKEDIVTGTHRGHCHCLAKKVDIKKLMAEIYGKRDGFCGGRGGSMHIISINDGVLGTNGIVGGGIPLSLGAALAFKLKKKNKISICFFGDGASNQGTFHESVNLAAILNLPIVFIVENNLYACSTHVSYSMKVENIADRAKAYGITSSIVDGTDPVEVYLESKRVIETLREGKGPHILECKTYRFHGHYEGDVTNRYRPAEEEEYYIKNDCLIKMKKYVSDDTRIKNEEIETINKKVDRIIAEAIEFAESSQYPEQESCLEKVYKNY